MHIVQWEAARSGAGITVTMTDAGGVKRKQLVKKIEAMANGPIVAIGGDGARFPLNASCRDTSPEIASIAGELINLSADDLDNIAHADTGQRDRLLEKIKSVAASALGQAAGQ